MSWGEHVGVYACFQLTERNKQRPGQREALIARRARNTLAVTKLDRLDRSVRHDGGRAL